MHRFASFMHSMHKVCTIHAKLALHCCAYESRKMRCKLLVGLNECYLTDVARNLYMNRFRIMKLFYVDIGYSSSPPYVTALPKYCSLIVSNKFYSFFPKHNLCNNEVHQSIFRKIHRKNAQFPNNNFPQVSTQKLILIFHSNSRCLFPIKMLFR